MAKVIVTVPHVQLIIDAKYAPAFVEAVISAERYERRYKNGGYVTTVEPLTDGLEITPLSDEHYKIYKIAGEQE